MMPRIDGTVEQSTEYIDICAQAVPKAAANPHRQDRGRRITLAWTAALLSKIATGASTILALPMVYRALGQTGYAAYAAVTSSAGLIGALNLGIGGSLVSPIAKANANSNENEQAILVQAGLGPLVLLCLAGAAIAIPIVCFVPLRDLFGNVGLNARPELRAAAILAVAGTLASIPVSSVTFLRQAYQEMHLTGMIGACANALVCIGLIIGARTSKSVFVFVAVFVLIPLAGQTVNLLWLFSKRRFLFRLHGTFAWENTRSLIADGVRFVGADFAGLFVYQWPVYWIARTSSFSISSSFALCMQATLLLMSFVVGFFQPLWPSTADALARGDHEWISTCIRRGQKIVSLVGCVLFLVLLIVGGVLFHLWLRGPIGLSWILRGWIGAYAGLAIWEYYHFMIALGFGRLREAASDIFLRSIAFALSLPLLTKIGGIPLVWCGMCCSILFWTAWRLPRLLHMSAIETAA